eukprot:scaffold267425_cov41-Prasinocladus_malaysianus.AAC.2
MMVVGSAMHTARCHVSIGKISTSMIEADLCMRNNVIIIMRCITRVVETKQILKTICPARKELVNSHYSSQPDASSCNYKKHEGEF